MVEIKHKKLGITAPKREYVWQRNLSFVSPQFLSLEFDQRRLIPEEPPSYAQASLLGGVLPAIVYSPHTNDLEAQRVYNSLRESGTNFYFLGREDVRKDFRRLVEEETSNVEKVAGERFVEAPSVELVRAEEYHERTLCRSYDGLPVYFSPYIRCVTVPIEKKIFIPDRNFFIDRPDSDEYKTEAQTMISTAQPVKPEFKKTYLVWEINDLRNALFEELFHCMQSQKRGEWGEVSVVVPKKGMTMNINESLAQVAMEKGLEHAEPERKLNIFDRALSFWKNKDSFSTYRAVLAMAERYPLTKIGMFDFIDYFEIFNPLLTRIIAGKPGVRVGISPNSKCGMEISKEIMGE